MKVYFYGATEESAKKKCNTFIKQLLKMEPSDKSINITSIAKVDIVPDFPIPNAFKHRVFCEYSLMKK